VLYSAPWCGFCKKAAAHLRLRGIPFEERDIDSDRSAAVELSKKLRQAGLSGGGVPVLDIAGTIVIGFKPDRIDRLLDQL
jgi:glutaredoxin 3